MFVTIEVNGCRCKKEASLSSASATKYELAPSFALVPELVSFPPITNVGSNPPAAKTEATKDVVVVLPWVPATAIPWR